MALPTAGQLRRRLTINKRIETPNNANNLDSSYAPVATVWCKREAVKGSAYFTSRQVGDDITHRFTVRHNPTIMAAADLGTMYELECDGQHYRPQRMYELTDTDRFTVIEAVELGSRQ